ncbi:MAG: hypothetical protein ACTHU0_19205 [Kofleriaceae bacterium]
MSLPGNQLEIREMGPDDLAFVRATWRESYKHAPVVERMPWPAYRARICPVLYSLIERHDVSLIGAYDMDNRILGWLAWSPGRSISTVHWAYTRDHMGEEKLRRRGIMTTLLDAADLGPRFLYTHKGEHRRGGGGADRRRRYFPRPLDEEVVDWLRSRGQIAVHEDIHEWLK